MEKLKNRLNRINSQHLSLIKTVLQQSGVFFLSLLFGGISFAGGISPFGVGFVAGVSNTYLIVSAVGAAAGYAVFTGLLNALRFVAAICIILLFRLGFEEKIIKHKMIISVALAGVSSFLSSLAVFAATGGENTFIILCLCEAIIAGAFSCFTFRLSGIAVLRKKGAYFAPTDIISTVFFGCILLLSLERFSVFGFSPARIIAYFVIMLFALCGKEAASSIAGICSALTLGFNENHPQLMLTYILTGLITGLTGVYGKMPIALSLVVASAISLILKGTAETALIAICEVALSGIAFVFIPEKIMLHLANAVFPLSRDTFSEEKGRSLQFLLKRSAKAVKDISSTVSAVSEVLQKTDKPSQEEVILQVKEDICSACTKYDFCWNKCKELTDKAFSQTNKTLFENERLIPEILPDRLTIVCRMPDKITESFNRYYYEYLARLVARQEIFNAKKAAARQFYSLGSILDDASENLCNLPDSDPTQSLNLMPVFNEMGFSVSGISTYTSQKGKSVLQVYCSHVPVIENMGILLENIFETTGKYYLPPVADEYSKDGTVLSFCEENNFTVEYHISSHTGSGEVFCGDTAQCFFDGTGNFYAVLSDGMGTGSRAAVDSVMTCSLMSRLMRAGFSPECALEAVNCALLVKSGEESLSTLDILKIELETGIVSFYKAGASFSVIKKAEKTLVVEKSSLPLGILGETLLEKSEIPLSDKDTVFLISDGAAVIPHITFKEIIQNNKNTDTKKLSEIIVQKALEMSPSGKHDDITVICIRLKAQQ